MTPRDTSFEAAWLGVVLSGGEDNAGNRCTHEQQVQQVRPRPPTADCGTFFRSVFVQCERWGDGRCSSKSSSDDPFSTLWIRVIIEVWDT